VNKLIVAGALALGLVLTAQQEASAWSKWSFGAGIWANGESGNNNYLWGAFRSGQVPGYPTDVYQGLGSYGAGGPPAGPGYAGGPAFGGYGGGYPDYPMHAGSGPVAPTMTEPPLAQPAAKTNTQAVYYPNSGYQPAAYYPNTGSYQYPNYGANYGYGYGYAQQVPSYWYGR
jgi:hypothetical protein